MLAKCGWIGSSLSRFTFSRTERTQEEWTSIERNNRGNSGWLCTAQHSTTQHNRFFPCRYSERVELATKVHVSSFEFERRGKERGEGSLFAFIHEHAMDSFAAVYCVII